MSVIKQISHLFAGYNSLLFTISTTTASLIMQHHTTHHSLRGQLFADSNYHPASHSS